MGIRLRDGDELLSMVVVDDQDAALMVVTDGGFGKRTALTEYKQQGRGGSGVLTAAIAEKRGQLVGALVVHEGDEVFLVTSGGVVIRVPVTGLRLLSRATGGVRLMSLEAGATVVSVARNGEAEAEQALAAGAEPVPGEGAEPVVLDEDGELVPGVVAEHVDDVVRDSLDDGPDDGSSAPEPAAGTAEPTDGDTT